MPVLPFQPSMSPSRKVWCNADLQRIWMALEERNIPYTYHEVNVRHSPLSSLTFGADKKPYKKEKEFLQVNPLGLVPSLEHKGVGSLYESDVLVEYLEDLYPDSSEHP